ncbi:MAG: MucR family transcriptional regulator [Magnetovibrio sp.]|nr:MucR family transcriptional regulator [Magnetovibrio sp.]|tara:strand:+ start:2029 stop:2442 length:414 start_codon:yes stop_codon:yes gene_type:complete
MDKQLNVGELIEFTTEIVTAHVGNNKLTQSEIPSLIHDVYNALSELNNVTLAHSRPTPAVSIRRSINPDYLVCLEDGKKLKMLKRHLKTVYNMTPEDYRGRWDLPRDYPMVAPNYAKHRSSLAKKTGLGTKSRNNRK